MPVEQGGERVDRQRLGEVVALPVLAGQPAQCADLLRLLDALGDELRVQGVSELGDGGEDDRRLRPVGVRSRGVGGRLADPVDERFVDLEDVHPGPPVRVRPR